MLRVNRLAVSALLGLTAFTPFLSVQAHDTWFVPSHGLAAYHLNTGSHFPQLGGSVPHSRVDDYGCMGSDGEPTGVASEGISNEFIVSLSDIVPGANATCWASLKRRSITLNNREVKQYLAETKADGQWQAYYKGLQAQGKPWVESYRKSARVESTYALNSAIVDLPFQARLASDSVHRTATANQAITLEVLLDKKPLVNQAVELLVDAAPIGVWYETDEHGLVEIVPPVAGQALLRGTHFSLKDGFVRTEFLTYTFPVSP